MNVFIISKLNNIVHRIMLYLFTGQVFSNKYIKFNIGFTDFQIRFML